MAVELLSKTGSFGGNFVTTHTIVVPATVKPGQLLVICANTRANRNFNPSPITGGSGGTWNRVGTDAINNVNSSSGVRLAVLQRLAAVGDAGATLTFTINGTDWLLQELLVIDSEDPTNPFLDTPIVSGVSTATALTKTLTGITTTVDGSLILAVAGGNNNLASTLQMTTLPGAPWTEEVDLISPNGFINLAVYSQRKELAGASGSITVTFEETARGAGIVFAIAPDLSMSAAGFWA